MVAIVPLSRVPERLGLLAFDKPGDVLARVVPGLQRDRSELRQDRVRLGISDPGDIPDREHFRVARDAEIRPYRDPVAPLQLQAERSGRRGSPAAPRPTRAYAPGSPRPDFNVTRVDVTDSTTSPTCTCTSRPASAFLAYARRLGLNMVKISGPASTSRISAFS